MHISKMVVKLAVLTAISSFAMTASAMVMETPCPNMNRKGLEKWSNTRVDDKARVKVALSTTANEAKSGSQSGKK